MMSVSLRRLFRVVSVLALFNAAFLLAASRWPDITAGDFAQPPALIDPEAGAEVLVSETTMDESSPEEIVWEHFLRVRILDDRGVNRFRKIELAYDGSKSISRIEAKTYKPDGSVLALDRKEIFERDVVKTRSSRRSVVSFAPPGLEPGVILEYSYVEHRENISAFWPLNFQRDLPARLVRFRLKPYPVPGYGLRSISFNVPPFNLKADAQGTYTLEATNLKGWKSEPFQLPPMQLQAAALIYYTQEGAKISPDRYWADAGERLHQRTATQTKTTKAVRAFLDGLIAPDDAPDSKLRKIHDAVRARIVNHDKDTAGYTGEQRRKLPKNDNAEETLGRGHGRGDDLVIAFTALARAAGFDARLALANDRTFILYTEKMREPFVFTKLVAAVRTGETWTFCDPGAVYLPFGVLDWKYTGTIALVADRERAILAPVPPPGAAASGRTRKATLALDEQGTLEGHITVTNTGYFDLVAKNKYDALSPAEREKSLKEEVQKQFPLAELSDITFEHAADPLQPLVLSYLLRVPGFAEQTGTRLFLQPAVLHKGVPPLFDAPTRRSPIIFNHLYHERDSFEIGLPPGCTLEAGNAPAALDLGNFGRYAVTVGYASGRALVIYSREFELLGPGAAQKHYPAVKRLFEEVHARDNHVLTFRTAPGTGPTARAAETSASATPGRNDPDD